MYSISWKYLLKKRFRLNMGGVTQQDKLVEVSVLPHLTVKMFVKMSVRMFVFFLLVGLSCAKEYFMVENVNMLHCSGSYNFSEVRFLNLQYNLITAVNFSRLILVFTQLQSADLQQKILSIVKQQHRLKWFPIVFFLPVWQFLPRLWLLLPVPLSPQVFIHLLRPSQILFFRQRLSATTGTTMTTTTQR